MSTTTSRPVPVDPVGAAPNPAFCQGMIVPAGPTLYVGGQNGVDGDGSLVRGLRAQTEQALRNLLDVLRAAGTDADHVAKLTIHLAPDVDPNDAYAASAAVWGERRTAVTVLAVAPARPGALVEIEAVAAVPAL